MSFTDAASAKKFMFAGKASVVLMSKKTKKHFSYKIKSAKYGGFFVSCNGQYLGMIQDMNFRTTAKSVKDDSLITPLLFALQCLSNGVIHPALDIMHEGKCGCCGRKLTNPESIVSGIGPICANR